jgi:glycosyltransferase involved in cell wall biosynthesis
MMKVWINDPAESWIVDRLRQEFIANTSLEVVDKVEDCDVIWLFAPWTWYNLDNYGYWLDTKPVMLTLHHDYNECNKHKIDVLEFLNRNPFVNLYTVYTDKMIDLVGFLTDHKKEAERVHHWSNPDLFKVLSMPRDTKQPEHIVVGSFQRDTEGASIASGEFLPKLEKGPDILAATLVAMKEEGLNPFARLAGYRRDYVKRELDKYKIPYEDLGLLDPDKLNEAYHTLDYYFVTSRSESGPQAIFEAALTRTPILSTDVGCAKEVLSQKCMCFGYDDETTVEAFIEKIKTREAKHAEVLEENLGNAKYQSVQKMVPFFDNLLKQVGGV